MDAGERRKSFPGSEENEKGHRYGGGLFDRFSFRAPNAWQTLRPLRVDRQPWLILRLSTVKQNTLGPSYHMERGDAYVGKRSG